MKYYVTTPINGGKNQKLRISTDKRAEAVAMVQQLQKKGLPTIEMSDFLMKKRFIYKASGMYGYKLKIKEL